MATFTYEVIAGRGNRQQGRIEANHREDAILELSKKGLYVVQMEEVQPSIWTKDIQFGKKRVKGAEFVAFCRQFATLVKSGISLVESLQVLAEQTRSKNLKSALYHVRDSVIEGTALSDSFGSHPHIFPQMFVQMVHAGEVSGTLDEVLESIASYTEKQHETMEKIKSAMVYPIAVGVFSIFVAAFLLIRVIPSFVSVFAQQHLTLPLPTRIVLDTSHFITHEWYLASLIVVGLLVAVFLLHRSPKAMFQKDRLIMRLPVFGTLIQKTLMARFSRTMSLLFHSAVPALQAITITGEVVGNRFLNSILVDARERLNSGESMVEPLRESGAFPPMVTQMMRIGEQTGNLDEMLGKVADFYEADVATMVDRLRQLIEPVMVAFLSVVVGGIVLAAMLPMFSLYQGMNA